MDIQELVRAQRTYFDTGATRPYAFRLAQLKKLQQALRDNEQMLEQAMMQDFRKAPMEVYMCETGMVLEELRFHLKHLKGWMRERAVPTPLAQFPAKSFVSPEPYGVALIISPWNYPVQLCLSPLVGAISGGNCAVVKPSAYAPATSAAIAKLIRETFDARYIAAVEGGRGEQCAARPAVRHDLLYRQRRRRQGRDGGRGKAADPRHAGAWRQEPRHRRQNGRSEARRAAHRLRQGPERRADVRGAGLSADRHVGQGRLRARIPGGAAGVLPGRPDG